MMLENNVKILLSSFFIIIIFISGCISQTTSKEIDLCFSLEIPASINVTAACIEEVENRGITNCAFLREYEILINTTHFCRTCVFECK